MSVTTDLYSQDSTPKKSGSCMCSSLWVCAHVVCTCLSTAQPNWLVIKLEALNKYKRTCLLWLVNPWIHMPRHFDFQYACIRCHWKTIVYWFTQWFKQWIVQYKQEFIYFLPLNGHLFVIVRSTKKKKLTPLFFIYFQFTCYLQKNTAPCGCPGLG